MEQFIYQALGFIGLIVFAISFQIKENKKLLIVQTLGGIAFVIQFLLLDGWGGAINSAIPLVRNMMLAKKEDWPWVKWKGWPYIFAVICLVSTIYNWNGLFSIFAFTAAAGGTFFYWAGRASAIRLGVLCVISPSWMLYDIGIGSIGGILSEVLCMTSSIISIKRFGWKALKEQEQ